MTIRNDDDGAVTYFQGKMESGWRPSYGDDGRKTASNGGTYRMLAVGTTTVDWALIVDFPDGSDTNQYRVAEILPDGQWVIH